ncbi:hypothetical protein CEXT_25561 [Caerostris extrusa]|uniref:Uncharacterized protein n=1 Tax=Caerostris extrusa TaxID=172846 RepID=A0AAV4Y7E2_CAEEX|nr:hypothetical protein CEXT_25561 [Caerostris extrusa]
MRLLPVANEGAYQAFIKEEPPFFGKSQAGSNQSNLMELPDSFTVRGETICSKICGQIRNLKRHGTKPLRICVSDIHYTSGGSGGEKKKKKKKKGIKS